MKKISAFLLVFILLFTSWNCALAAKKNSEPTATPETIPQPTLAPDAPEYDKEHPEDLVPEQLYAASAILVTQDKGEVIFEKDADTVRYPASMTKILTVLLGILYVDDPEQMVTVSETAVNVPSDSSTMYLKAGEEIKFIDVLYGTMLLSANDGANVIAETVAGDIPHFVALMNESAANMGCINTHFENAHGYHDDNHYSTARDIAVIAREAMKNDLFRQIAGTVSYQLPKTNKNRARSITTKTEYMLTGSEDNPNQYFYEYATGIKTGSHSHSGYCFAGSASKDGVELVSVVMFTGRRARWADTIKLMNYGFSQYMSVTPVDIFNMNPITIVTSNYSTSDTQNGKLQLVCTPVDQNVSIVTTKGEIERIAESLTDVFNSVTNIFQIQYTRDFRAPIRAGEEIGYLYYTPPYADTVRYLLTASRTIDQREDAPKTLEEIVAETYSDPNPFPPFNFEFCLILFGPPLVLIAVIILLVRRHEKKRTHKMRAPAPVNRYVK